MTADYDDHEEEHNLAGWISLGLATGALAVPWLLLMSFFAGAAGVLHSRQTNTGLFVSCCGLVLSSLVLMGLF